MFKPGGCFHFVLTKCALIYPHACADLPSLRQLFTGFNLHVYLFSQVAYNYIPVSLYPGVINQQNRSLRVTV